jgi:phosphocarrier protein HPr
MGPMVMGVVRRRVEILNLMGLHLRAAHRFVQIAQRYQARVRVAYEHRPADGKSILDLATLAAECGAVLDLEAEGPDAEEALLALVELVEARFFESDGAAHS